MSYRAHVLLAGPGPMISPTSIVHSGPHLCSQVIFPPRPEVPLQQTVSVRSLSHHPVSRGAPIQAPVPPVRLVTVRAYEPQGGAEFHFYSRLEPTIPKRFDQYPESMMASPSYGGASDDQSRPKWNNSHYTQHLLASKGQGSTDSLRSPRKHPKSKATLTFRRLAAILATQPAFEAQNSLISTSALGATKMNRCEKSNLLALCHSTRQLLILASLTRLSSLSILVEQTKNRLKVSKIFSSRPRTPITPRPSLSSEMCF